MQQAHKPFPLIRRKTKGTGPRVSERRVVLREDLEETSKKFPKTSERYTGNKTKSQKESSQNFSEVLSETPSEADFRCVPPCVAKTCAVRPVVACVAGSCVQQIQANVQGAMKKFAIGCLCRGRLVEHRLAQPTVPIGSIVNV